MTTTTSFTLAPVGEWGTWAPNGQTFGARLVLLRHSLGWTNVARAARECGIPVGTWRQWESGTTPRDLERVADRIAARTGANQLWIMTGRVLSGVELCAIRDSNPEPAGLQPRRLALVA